MKTLRNALLSYQTAGLIIVILLVAAFLSPAGADSTDSDGDGLPDKVETAGISLSNNLTLAGTPHPGRNITYIPPCRPDGLERTSCLDPDSPDLFVILHPLKSGSGFPFLASTTALRHYFSNVSDPLERGGLAVNVHTLRQEPVPSSRTRRITADGPEAVRVTESDLPLKLPIEDDANLILGYSAFGGRPMKDANVSVHTVRIRQYLCHVCGGVPDRKGNCAGGTFGTADCRSYSTPFLTGENLVAGYTRYIIQHEIGHALSLPEHTDLNAAEKGFVMAQTINILRKGEEVVFYLPATFCPDCQTGFRMR